MLSGRALNHHVIERERGFRPVSIGELWQYRELIWLLAARDLKTRYRQSLLGIAWSVLQPLFTLGIFLAFFSLVGRPTTTTEVPLAMSLLCGIILWNYFASVLSSAANALPANAHLIMKVYCPRLVFPLASLVVALADLLVALAVLGLMMTLYTLPPLPSLLLTPIFVLLTSFVALAGGLLISALSVRWRDVRFTIPVLLQAGFFASPVVYETKTLIPIAYQQLYCLNPMAGCIEGFRWTVLGGARFHWGMLAASAPLSLVILLIALVLFRRVERTLPDYL